MPFFFVMRLTSCTFGYLSILVILCVFDILCIFDIIFLILFSVVLDPVVVSRIHRHIEVAKVPLTIVPIVHLLERLHALIVHPIHQFIKTQDHTTAIQCIRFTITIPVSMAPNTPHTAGKTGSSLCPTHHKECQVLIDTPECNKMMDHSILIHSQVDGNWFGNSEE